MNRSSAWLAPALAAVVLAVGCFEGGFGAGRLLARGDTGVAAAPVVGAAPIVTGPSVPGHLPVVALVGDSLLYGGVLPDSQAPPSLIQRADPADLVIDLAAGATRPADVLTRLTQVRLLHPDVIVLWLGSTDADVKEPVATFEADYGALLDRLTAPHLILVTPIATRAAGAASIAPFVDAVTRAGAARHLTVIDAGAGLTPADYDTDGVHLIPAATAKVAGLITAALTSR